MAANTDGSRCGFGADRFQNMRSAEKEIGHARGRVIAGNALVTASVFCGIGRGCGIGSCGVPRPSLGDYVRGGRRRRGLTPPERPNVSYALCSPPITPSRTTQRWRLRYAPVAST